MFSCDSINRVLIVDNPFSFLTAKAVSFRLGWISTVPIALHYTLTQSATITYDSVNTLISIPLSSNPILSCPVLSLVSPPPFILSSL